MPLAKISGHKALSGDLKREFVLHKGNRFHLKMTPEIAVEWLASLSRIQISLEALFDNPMYMCK